MNIYVHIPFCAAKCSYCHFYSTTNTEAIPQYIEALCHEIEIGMAPRTPVETIYFGGGTPSRLTSEQLELIIQSISQKSPIKPIEITLEANPESLTRARLAAYVHLGINRLSIGVQTWNEVLLRHMKRSMAVNKLPSLISFAKEIGLNNINIDHIIAYPGQSIEMLVNDLNQTLSLQPAHISIYPLEIHPLTLLAGLIKAKKIKPSTKTEIVEQFSVAQRKLVAAGFSHYEELSFAKPEYECRHNLDFWKGLDYLGFGVSASSRFHQKIFTNTSSISNYIDFLRDGQLPPRVTATLTTSNRRLLNKELHQRLLK